MKLISGYMRDDRLRHLLNDLTEKTFGFDFEGWVGGGYYEGDYIPYSFLEDGRIISNVSANRMVFMQNGAIKNYIQIGTVMTDEKFRGQGLAGKLIKHVIGQYENKCDGIYLFGNLSAAGFYRKMSFIEGSQYRYFVKDKPHPQTDPEGGFIPVDASDAGMKRKYEDTVRMRAANSSFEQVNSFGLQMFYTAGMDSMYYSKELDCFIVMNKEENTVVIKSIVCRKRAALAEVLRRIDGNYNSCRLGFVPHQEDKEMCLGERYDGGEDYRFFYIGGELESIQRDKLYFPELSHA